MLDFRCDVSQTNDVVFHHRIFSTCLFGFVSAQITEFFDGLRMWLWVVRSNGELTGENVVAAFAFNAILLPSHICYHVHIVQPILPSDYFHSSDLFTH